MAATIHPPNKPDDPINKAFLESLLGEPVTSFTVKPGASKGDNVGGSLLAINVHLTSGRTTQLIHKGLAGDEGSGHRAWAIMVGIFWIENKVYSTIAPALEELAKSRGLDLVLPIPTYIGGICNGTDDFLCLEDVRAQGYEMPNKFLGLNFHEVNLALDFLATWHAMTYFWIRWEGEKLFESPEYQRFGIPLSQLPPEFRGVTCLLHQELFQSCVKVLKRRNKELASRVKARLNQFSEDPRTLYPTQLKTDSIYFPVLTHGDFWANNILFKYEDQGGQRTPVSLRVIDFAMTRRGNIFEDLTYFIFTSTTPEFRRSHLTQVLSSYFQNFQSTLTLVNFPLPHGFTLEFLLDQFSECTLTAYKFMTFAIPFQLGIHPPEEEGQGQGESGGLGLGSGPEVKLNCNGNEIKDADDEEESPFVSSIRGMAKALAENMERSPIAMDRLEALTHELIDLNLL